MGQSNQHWTRKRAEGKTAEELQALIKQAEEGRDYLESRREFRVEFDDIRERCNAAETVSILKGILAERQS